MRRRSFLGVMGLLPVGTWAAKREYPNVVPGRAFVFPRDHGAHPEYPFERWYVAGWLDGPLGFHITVFRAPGQVLIARAALSDPKRGRLIHEERPARAGFSLAHAETDRTGVWIDDWSLVLEGSLYRAHIAAREFEFDFTFWASQLVLQGEGGFSRKGHRPHEASYYYSRPQLAVGGRLNGQPVSGSAWLDHEWSSAYMAPQAVGCDWAGINLAGGGDSIMGFRMRDRAGGTHFAPSGIQLEPLRFWTSPRTGVEYPVSMRLNDLRLEPLMDDQELDLPPSSGTASWEGAVRAFRGDAEAGKGYLQLTGYVKASLGTRGLPRAPQE